MWKISLFLLLPCHAVKRNPIPTNNSCTAHRCSDGLFFKLYPGTGHKWFNNYAAALFYEIFWCLFVFLLVRSSKAVIQIPLWVFSITCVLEFMQLWHPPVLQQFRATFLGRMLIGTTFSW